MRNFKSIGIALFLMVAMTVSAQPNRRQRSNSYQDPMVQKMEKTQRALQNLQEMLGPADPEVEAGNTVMDRDSNVYNTVKIGNNVWMAVNLKVTHYRNGDSIANVKDSAAWMGLKTGAWCQYNNNADNGAKYGKLYNYFAVSDKRNIAPKGWHVATDADWTSLVNYLAGKRIRNEGKIITQILDGSNKLGFYLNGGAFYSGFKDGGNAFSTFWTSNSIATDSDGTEGALFVKIEASRGEDVIATEGTSGFPSVGGCSVRCVKDVEVPKPVVTTTSKPRVKSKKK